MRSAAALLTEVADGEDAGPTLPRLRSPTARAGWPATLVERPRSPARLRVTSHGRPGGVAAAGRLATGRPPAARLRRPRRAAPAEPCTGAAGAGAGRRRRRHRRGAGAAPVARWRGQRAGGRSAAAAAISSLTAGDARRRADRRGAQAHRLQHQAGVERARRPRRPAAACRRPRSARRRTAGAATARAACSAPRRRAA